MQKLDIVPHMAVAASLSKAYTPGGREEGGTGPYAPARGRQASLGRPRHELPFAVRDLRSSAKPE